LQHKPLGDLRLHGMSLAMGQQCQQFAHASRCLFCHHHQVVVENGRAIQLWIHEGERPDAIGQAF